MPKNSKTSLNGKKHSITSNLRPAHFPTPAPAQQPDRSASNEICGPKRVYRWEMERGPGRNFHNLGKLLASICPQLYRASDIGLIQVLPGDRVRQISSAKELAPLLIDTLRIRITKEGKLLNELINVNTLNYMLRSEEFLRHFSPVNEITKTPAYLPDFSITRPGYNAGILYLGPPAVIANGIETINKFLAVMDWASEADRTNAVAAALTVLLRHHFPGGKPLVLVTATKSHAGKGTVIDFVVGRAEKAEITYQDKDWPMVKSLHQELCMNPGIGLINLDNVRTDSGGRARIIRSGYFESFITSAEISLNAPGVRHAFRAKNKFVVALNTNDGSLSADLLNRALPIHLAPQGDVTNRTSLIGNPKLKFLPENREQIEAELRWMIERWISEGMPLDESVTHPMSVWAQTIGGILKVNGFKNFLANYSSTRSVADPIREALGILAASNPGTAKRPGDWASIVVSQGLAKTLFLSADRDTLAGQERAIGRLLSNHVEEKFTVSSEEGEPTVYRLVKQFGRWKGNSPHVRYTFEVVTDAEQHPTPLTESITPAKAVMPRAKATAKPRNKAKRTGNLANSRPKVGKARR